MQTGVFFLAFPLEAPTNTWQNVGSSWGTAKVQKNFLTTSRSKRIEVLFASFSMAVVDIRMKEELLSRYPSLLPVLAVVVRFSNHWLMFMGKRTSDVSKVPFVALLFGGLDASSSTMYAWSSLEEVFNQFFKNIYRGKKYI